VRGNHDKHAGDPAATLDIELVDEPHQVGPFAFCHHPDLDWAAAPAMRWPATCTRPGCWRRASIRCACRASSSARAHDPAVLRFVYGRPHRQREAGDAIFVTSGEAVHSVR
jgi:hypothetical protein